MTARLALTPQRLFWVRYWLPSVVAGGTAWLLFLLADTPLVRASGLALVIAGITLALRRLGAFIAVVGGLTLALCPAFWAQTGGGEGNPATIVLALAIAGLIALAGSVLIRRPVIAIGVAVTVFAGLFWMQIGTPRSIRLTGFTTSWLMFLLIDMLLLTNPHPTESVPPPIMRFKPIDSEEDNTPQFYHLWGIVLLFGLGILNDPLMVLLAPAIALALYLTRTRLSSLYGVLFGIIVGIGLRGLFVDYIQGQSHRLALDAWRQGRHWLTVVNFIVEQFGWPATLLSVLGLARLSRWYPVLGNVSLIGYAAYVAFALVYDGPTKATLLLPMLIIQIVWLTYAVFTLGEWVLHNVPRWGLWLRRGVFLLYGLLPLSMGLMILKVI
jgi:hypothetical protein